PSPIAGLPAVTTAIASGRHKDRWATALSFPSHRRDDADETEGRGRAGVPPQQTAHTAGTARPGTGARLAERTVALPGRARPP
ncbi:hypothetical protein, partial [Streptomyces mirabilis]|uniref:hypothetical protein n=1 Tax=Streptomyces mirabilis TaxID=68239 RepID=UPI0036B1E8A9